MVLSMGGLGEARKCHYERKPDGAPRDEYWNWNFRPIVFRFPCIHVYVCGLYVSVGYLLCYTPTSYFLQAQIFRPMHSGLRFYVTSCALPHFASCTLTSYARDHPHTSPHSMWYYVLLLFYVYFWYFHGKCACRITGGIMWHGTDFMSNCRVFCMVREKGSFRIKMWADEERRRIHQSCLVKFQVV